MLQNQEATRKATAKQDAADDQTTGCLKRLGIPLVAAVVVIIAGILLASNLLSSDDSSKQGAGTATNCSQTGARRDGAMLIACTAPTGIAGHWELASGLRNPDGLDEGTKVLRPGFTGTVTLGSRSASIDIGDDGAVTGGAYDTSHTEVDDTCTKTVSLSASTASGSFQPDGFGTVTWNGKQTQHDSCRDETGETTFPLQMYFFQDEAGLVACRLGPGATIPTVTPTACSGDEAARFQKL